MSSNFDESELLDAPPAFDESELLDSPPRPQDPGVGLTARFRRAGGMGQEQIDAERGYQPTGLAKWLQEPLIKGEAPLTPATMSKRELSGGSNLGDNSAIEGVAKGLANTAEGVADFMASPAGIATTVATGGLSAMGSAAAPLVGRLTSLGFATDMITKAPALWRNAVAAYKHYEATGDKAPLAQAATEAAASGFFLGSMLKHGLGPGEKTPPVRSAEPAAPGVEAPPAEPPPAGPTALDETELADEPPARDHVTFTPVMSPEERAAEAEADRPAREAYAKMQAQNKARAIEHLKKGLPEQDFKDVPLPQRDEDLQSLMPTDEEVAEVRRKSMYRDGAVELGEIPTTLKEKIGATNALDGLMEQYANFKESGGKAGFVYNDDFDMTTNFDKETGKESNYKVVKSPLPKEVKAAGRSNHWTGDEIFDVIQRARAGAPLTPTEAQFYNGPVMSWAARQGRLNPLDVYRTQDYLESHQLGVTLVPIREEIEGKAIEAQERAGMEAEDEGSSLDFSAADLEHRAPVGTSEVLVPGRDGEPLNPLNPPEQDLATALDDTLTKHTQGDPQKIAELLRGVYGIKQPVEVRIDPRASVPRTEQVEGGPPLAGGYPPTHPWYYRNNGRVLAVEEIPGSPPPPGMKPVPIEQARKFYEESVARYEDLISRGEEAISPYDKMMGYGMDTQFALAYNHIVAAKGNLGGTLLEKPVSPPDGGSFLITIPPDATPTQIAHEVGIHVREMSGQMRNPVEHDNNLIAARILGDLRAAGGVEHHENGLPKRAFATVAANPMARSSGRTFDLDQPFPAAASRDAATPALKNIFDPQGLLDPDNRAMHQSINERLMIEGANILKDAREDTNSETFHQKFQDWHAAWLRDKGFDGEVWKDELGRHVTELQKGESYQEGAAQASEVGEPKAGAPEAGRIQSDYETLRDFAQQNPDAPPIVPGEKAPTVSRATQQAEKLAAEEPAPTADAGEVDLRPEVPDVDPQVAALGAPVDVEANIPLVTPFVRHDVIPVAKSILQGVKDTALGLGHALMPRAFVDDTYLDTVMQKLGVKNKELALFRVNVAIRKARSAFDKLSKADQIAFIDRQKTGAPHPTPELQAWGDMMQKLEDHWYGMLDAEMQQHGKSLPYIAHHLALLYKDPVKAAAQMAPTLAAIEAKYNSNRPFEGSKDFTKKMVYQTLTDAMNAGLDPVSTNPFVLMELRLADNMKFLAARGILRELKGKKAVQFVPKFKERQFLAAKPGWVPIEDRISKIYFPTEQGMVDAGTYFWEPNTARILNNYLSYDVVRQSKLGRGALAMKNFTTAIELSLSPFHFFFINGDAAATATSIGFRKLARGELKSGMRDIAANILGAPVSYFGAPLTSKGLDRLPNWVKAMGGGPMQFRVEGNRMMRYLSNKDEFLQTPAGKEFVAQHPNIDHLIDQMFSSGAALGMSEDYRLKSYQTIREHFNQGNMIGVGLRAFPAAAQAMMQPLFDHYIPEMKLGAWMAEFGEELKSKSDDLIAGRVSEGTLGRTAWDRMEDRFGELHFDNLFWNRGMKTSLQLLFRSVTWKLGNARTIGRAMTQGVPNQVREFDVALFDPINRMEAAARAGNKAGFQTAMRDMKMPKLDADLTYLASVCMYTAITGTIAQYLFTAHHDGVEKGKAGLAAIGAGKGLFPWDTDTPVLDAIMPRSGGVDRNGRPSRLMVPSYLRDWVSFRKSPTAYIGHSLSAVTGRAMEAWQNKDFYGNWVYDPESPILKKAALSVAHALAVKPISVSSFGEAKARGLTGPELWASGGGFSVASPTYFATDFESYMTRTLRRELEGRPGRSPEQGERAGKAQEVTQAIRGGREIPAGAGEALGREGLSRAARQGTIEGFEARASRLSLEQLLKGWHYAEDAEKKRLLPILQKKVNGARIGSKSPAQQQEILDAINAIREEQGQ